MVNVNVSRVRTEEEEETTRWRRQIKEDLAPYGIFESVNDSAASIGSVLDNCRFRNN
ncbi:hypothetical protein GBA52_000139 [Prunus armeniaca]|nr:hypothetical protein GBA52_000139 [Prunus armeniaca]